MNKLKVGDVVVSLHTDNIVYKNQIGTIVNIETKPEPNHYTHKIRYVTGETEWAYEKDFKKLTKLDKALQ